MVRVQPVSRVALILRGPGTRIIGLVRSVGGVLVMWLHT